MGIDGIEGIEDKWPLRSYFKFVFEVKFREFKPTFDMRAPGYTWNQFHHDRVRLQGSDKRWLLSDIVRTSQSQLSSISCCLLGTVSVQSAASF